MRELSVDYAGANLHKSIEEVKGAGEPVIILGRKSNVVLVGEGVWIAINETVKLLSVPGMHESIAEGMREGIGDCASELDW